MSGWTYPYSSGIDPAAEALRLSVGMGLGAGPEDRRWASAERAFISIPGRIASIEGRGEAERTPYVKQLFLRVSVGDRVVFPTNNVEKCGNVISQAPSREEAVRAAASAAGAIRVRLAAGEPETESFLGSDGGQAGGWPPPAFVVEGEAARELAAMPEYLDRTGPDDGPVAPFALARSVTGGDWSGRGFAESADIALSLRQSLREGERVRSESTLAIPARRTLAGRFWRALARGGLQAALYVLDTEDWGSGR